MSMPAGKPRIISVVIVAIAATLAIISAVLALSLSQIATWIVSMTVLEIAYRPFVGRSLLMILSTMLLVTAVGGLACRPILRQRPATFLREIAEG